MLARCVATLLSLASSASCEESRAQPAESPALVAMDGATVLARLNPGPPCRVQLGTYELIAGGSPLVAAVGAARLTAQRDHDGLTFLRDGAPIGRWHAQQLFSAVGEPLFRFPDNGTIVRDAQVVGDGRAVEGGVEIHLDGRTLQVTKTTDVVLATMLVARGADPELQALLACQLALASSARESFSRE